MDISIFNVEMTGYSDTSRIHMVVLLDWVGRFVAPVEPAYGKVLPEPCVELFESLTIQKEKAERATSSSCFLETADKNDTVTYGCIGVATLIKRVGQIGI